MSDTAPIFDDLVRAGASARQHSASLEPLIEGTARQIATLQEAMKALRHRQHNFDVGSEGERRAAARVQQVLLDFGSTNWHLLADRCWPGTRRANIDLILVGPPGVLLLDAKTWAEPRISAGALWRGQENADDELAKSRRAAESVAESLADIGLAPAAVQSLIVLVGRKFAGVEVGGVRVVGEKSLSSELLRLPRRLDSAQVSMLVAAVDERCPPASVLSPPRRRVISRATQATSDEFASDALLDTKDIWDAAIEAATREPIEAWMTWLHPAQTHLVTRRYSGPARVRGAAGTGKTVVALHRARELARRPGARVLVTSFVRTLPQVQESLFHRLAPDLAGRVEFRGLHSWAVRHLRMRGHALDIAGDDGRHAFETAWADVAPHGVLASSTLPKPYWQEEIEHVIKGRGLTKLDDYLGLMRIGRRTPLREEHRHAVWKLYLAYQQHLRDSGKHDWADVVLLALDSVRREQVAPPYTAVIVDEVQDLSCTGLKLLHALVGDAPDGLLLVGDGQQSVYPGGFTLRETGVSVAGRATVLNRNYRNAGEILAAAFEVVGSDDFDDLDESTVSAVRDIEIDRQGGVVGRYVAPNLAAERAELVRALKYAKAEGVRTGDMAVLVPDNRTAQGWASVLRNTGIEVALLDREYDGTTSDAVKVGTYQRAKGLEFACVFLPGHDHAVAPRSDAESDDAYRERAELQRRQLFVAMTRARDRLWLGALSR